MSFAAPGTTLKWEVELGVWFWFWFGREALGRFHGGQQPAEH